MKNFNNYNKSYYLRNYKLFFNETNNYFFLSNSLNNNNDISININTDIKRKQIEVLLYNNKEFYIKEMKKKVKYLKMLDQKNNKPDEINENKSTNVNFDKYKDIKYYLKKATIIDVLSKLDDIDKIKEDNNRLHMFNSLDKQFGEYLKSNSKRSTLSNNNLIIAKLMKKILKSNSKLKDLINSFNKNNSNLINVTKSNKENNNNIDKNINDANMLTSLKNEILNNQLKHIKEFFEENYSSIKLKSNRYSNNYGYLIKLNNAQTLYGLTKNINFVYSKNEILNFLDVIDKGNNSIKISNADNFKELNYNIEYNHLKFTENKEPPKLSFNMDAIVKKPGIYQLDEFIKAFSAYDSNIEYKMRLIKNLPTPDQIDFLGLDTYMTPSEDKTLHDLAKKNKKIIVSSTSGISGALTHFFYKLTNFKSPHFYGLSEELKFMPYNFMLFQRKPTFCEIKYNDGIYSISSMKQFESENEFILLKMGKYMEKLLTCTDKEFIENYMINEDFKNYNKSESKDYSDKLQDYYDNNNSNKDKDKKICLQLSNIDDEFYNYITFDKILLRSQIDCSSDIYDPITKSNKRILFEIKTRAVSPIRYDVHNYIDYIDYEVNKLKGLENSYEREFYDLIRGGFLKYLFQMKIGRMDGAFIAYHNTQSIFGFEYVKLEDIEKRIFGNCLLADLIFKACLKLLQESFLEILNNYKNKKLYFGIYANNGNDCIDVLVEIPDETVYNKEEKKYYKLKNKKEEKDIMMLNSQGVKFYYSSPYSENYIFVDDFYIKKGYNPIVDKYRINISQSINNIFTYYSMRYEKNDTFNVKYKIDYLGKVSTNEYFEFMHEATYQKDLSPYLNYSGIWSKKAGNLFMNKKL